MTMSNEDVIRELLNCVNNSDPEGMAKVIAPDITAFITIPGGGVDEVNNRDTFISRMPTAESKDAEGGVRITQVLPIDDEQIMVAVIVEAARKGKTLLNFAAFLLRVRDEKITEWRMVEAQPDYSDEFWKD